MKKVALVFISSFFAGMVTGVYVYITVFHPNFVLKTKDFFVGDREVVIGSESPNTDNGLKITGDSYGACLQTNDCKSYQVSGDGQFIYFDGTKSREGTISSELRRSLTKSVATAKSDLPMAVSASGRFCETAINQTEVIYTIEYKNQTYKLDTCHHTFVNQSGLGQLLSDFWDILPDYKK